MKNIKLVNLFVLALLLMLGACRDDVVDIETKQERPDPTIIVGYKPDAQPITSSVLGHVINENNENVVAAEVKLGSRTTLTDEYGHFIFKDVEMNANGTYVEVTQPGFYKGSRRFYPVEGHRSNVKIQLLERTIVGSFAATNGGIVQAQLGGTVSFPANAIVDADDEVYTGQVNVAARWLSPLSESLPNEMPGDLLAVNELNDEVVLATYGMMAVELESATGAPLNIAEDKTATMSFPVPTELLAQAPTEIPLWYFNENYGIWAQDGKAELQGSNYVGTVSHFTFWNCDAPYDLINLDFTVVDGNGDALANHTVSVTLGGTNTASGQTDNMGFVSGKVPANEPLTLGVYSHCGDILLLQDIGPFSTDASLGNVVIPNSGSNIITTVAGNLLNCDGNPVTNGVVIAEFGTQTEYYYTDGTPFSFTFSSCLTGQNVDLTAVDLDNAGQVYTASATSGTNIDLGNMDVCVTTAPENTITVTIDGTTYVYSNGMAEVGAADSLGTTIYSDLGPDLQVRMFSPSTTVGTHDVFVEVVMNDDLGWHFRGNGPQSFEITEIGNNPGDKVEGILNGSLFDINNGGALTNVIIEFDIIHQ